MSFEDGEAVNAAWWVAAAMVFLLFQAGAWLRRRGQWAKLRTPVPAVSPPRLFGPLARGVAAFLLNVLPVLAAALPILAAGAWLAFCFVVVGHPLATAHGPAMGAAGGLFVAAVGMAFGIAVVVALGDEGRSRDRYKAGVLLAEMRSEGDRRQGNPIAPR